jgi:hypothetical protein
MSIIGWIIAFAIIGAIVVSIANTDKEKTTESAIGGGIMGIIVFAGILLFIVLPILFLSSC